MAKVSILAGKVQCDSTGKTLESFTAPEGMEIVDLYCCVWDNTNHKPMDGQAEIALYESIEATKKLELIKPTKARLIAEMKSPLKIEHHPEKDRTIKLMGTSPTSEYIAYVLRVATP